MAKGIKRKLAVASRRISSAIAESIDRDSYYSAGLSGEGYVGGYRDALEDVLLALNGVEPNSAGFRVAGEVVLNHFARGCVASV